MDAEAEDGGAPSPRRGIRDLAVLAALVAAVHLTLFPRLASLDAYYHMGHAAHYLEAGPFDAAFPWATQSVIGAVGADLWWGFHVVLIPFAVLGDPAFGGVVAAVVLTGILALTVYRVLAGFGVAAPGIWTALFLVAVPNVLYRFSMVRPHVVSLAAALVLLAALVRERHRVAGLAAGLITWLHLSLFWMAPGILCAWIVGTMVEARGLRGLRGRGRSVGAAAGWVLLGSVAGWLLRPNPMGAADLAWIQIVELFAEKGTEQPIPFAVELRPLPVGELVRTSWLFLGVWTAALVSAPFLLAGRRRPTTAPDHAAVTARRLAAVVALLCSVAFLVLTLASARRAQVEWVAFGFLAIPLLYGLIEGADLRRRLRLAGVALLLVHLPWAAWRHTLNSRLVAFPPDLLAGASVWLSANSAPGDVVFHAKWDNFGPLFARNRTNRYLSGMDPIFFYRHDPERYWEYFFLSADATTDYTCDAFPCASGVATGTHEVIRDHFGARWVVVEPQRNPRLTQWLHGAAGFRLGVDTGRELVFEVLDRASDVDEPGGGDPAPDGAR